MSDRELSADDFLSGNIRPRGSVEVPCAGKGCAVPNGEAPWVFWVDAMDPRLPDGPFECGDCLAGVMPEKGPDSRERVVAKVAETAFNLRHSRQWTPDERAEYLFAADSVVPQRTDE